MISGKVLTLCITTWPQSVNFHNAHKVTRKSESQLVGQSPCEELLCSRMVEGQ